MSDTNSNEANSTDSPTTPINPFSNQATGLLETTFAETLGLSMHNAVSNQQSSQMTTSASVTNACARLLQAPKLVIKDKPESELQPDVDTKQTNQITEKKSFLKKISSMFKRNKTADTKSSGEKE